MTDEHPQCQNKEPVEMCDHVCLLPDAHVEEGEPHFYGYRGLGVEVQRLTADLARKDQALTDIAALAQRWLDDQGIHDPVARYCWDLAAKEVQRILSLTEPKDSNDE